MKTLTENLSFEWLEEKEVNIWEYDLVFFLGLKDLDFSSKKMIMFLHKDLSSIRNKERVTEKIKTWACSSVQRASHIH